MPHRNSWACSLVSMWIPRVSDNYRQNVKILSDDNKLFCVMKTQAYCEVLPKDLSMVGEWAKKGRQSSMYGTGAHRCKES